MIWKFTDNKSRDSIEQQFDWAWNMNGVPQDKLYHAEGNVAVHTWKVIEELQQLPAYSDLGGQDKEILWTAALLHDVEKRSATVVESDGRITARGHARKGEYTVRTLLYRDLPTPFTIREKIASLVRFHGLPLWLMEKTDPVRKIAEVAFRLDTSQLRILAEADIRGRICQDREELLESLDLFELFCREQGCWKKNREFTTDHARFRYFHTAESYIDYIPYEKFKCDVILLSGLPGMGKDHYIETSGTNLPVISLDDIRRKNKLSPTDKSTNGWVVQEAKKQARAYLRKGQGFIWNATNITVMMRFQLINLFAEYGARIKVVYIEKPYSVWRKQNREREYPLPEAALDMMLGKLEIPLLTEVHEIEYVVEDEQTE